MKEKFIERKIDLYKAVDSEIRKMYPGKKISCSSILKDSMEGIVYRCMFARNNEKVTVCMLDVKELDTNENYQFMLRFNNEEKVLYKKYFREQLSEKEIKANVKNELNLTNEEIKERIKSEMNSSINPVIADEASQRKPEYVQQ